MNKWILSVICTVFITTALYMLLPDNKLSKHIKNIFGLITILVIIQPIFSATNSDFKFELESLDSQVVFQKDYLDFMAKERIESYQNNCEIILKEKGFKNTKSSIEYSSDDLGNVSINKVLIDFKDVVIISENKHIDIIDDIVSPICDYLNIKPEIVEVVE